MRFIDPPPPLTHPTSNLSFTDISGDLDSRVSIAMVPRDTSVRQIIDLLHLDVDDRLSKNSERSQYRGSGQWSIWREEDGSIRIGVDVGCWCEHDCCGHLCGLSYTLTKLAGEIGVISSKRFNY